MSQGGKRPPRAPPAAAADEVTARKREMCPAIRERRTADLIGSNVWSLWYGQSPLGYRCEVV